jgi:hypothetical protein
MGLPLRRRQKGGIACVAQRPPRLISTLHQIWHPHGLIGDDRFSILRPDPLLNRLPVVRGYQRPSPAESMCHPLALDGRRP